MSIKMMIFSLAIVILLIMPQVVKRIIYKKLTTYLANGSYEEFEKLLDSYLCIFSFRPYNREYMRLTSYFMQLETQKIEGQFDRMFQQIKMKKEQEVAVAKQGFYFYMEIQNYEKSGHFLDVCKKGNVNDKDLHVMELMYDILALQKSDYIQEIKERVNTLNKQSNIQKNQADLVRLGIFEYLLGLQYTYKNEKKVSKKYLESALEHCKDTPYEQRITAILKDQ